MVVHYITFDNFDCDPLKYYCTDIFSGGAAHLNADGIRPIPIAAMCLSCVAR